MKIYSYFQSQTSFRVRIALALKGLKPEMFYVNLMKGEHREAAYAAINPQMIVPTVFEKDHKLSQSLAIMEYLDEAYPEPAIMPKDPFARAYVREMALMMATDISPLINLKVRKHLEAELNQDKDAQTAWVQHWVADGLVAVEKRLVEAKQAGAFFYKDTPTIADCCLAPLIFTANRFNCDFSPYPTIQRIAESCNAHPAFMSAHPSKQADAE